MTEKNIKHLEWVYERMVHVHKENPNMDYMIRFNLILEELKSPLNKIKNLKGGELVLDRNIPVQVEKVDAAGYILLDASFGSSTRAGIKNREKWIQDHGHDGRYSLSIEVAAERLTIPPEPEDLKKYPFHGICGVCADYKEKLDINYICQACYAAGVRAKDDGSDHTPEMLRFIKPRF
jgi:hypothetical protein